MHTWLRQDILIMQHSKHIVASYFRERQIDPGFDKYVINEDTPETKRHRTDDTKIAWLANQVQPTIKALLTRGRELEVAQALAPEDADREDVDNLAAALVRLYQGRRSSPEITQTSEKKGT
jgi:transglutaminase-like putative cysteine protease